MNGIVDPGSHPPLTLDWPTSPSWLYAFTRGLHVLFAIRLRRRRVH
jgi:hypothetical protein